jgi:hypothetical protein
MSVRLRPRMSVRLRLLPVGNQFRGLRAELLERAGDVLPSALATTTGLVSPVTSTAWARPPPNRVTSPAGLAAISP